MRSLQLPNTVRGIPKWERDRRSRWVGQIMQRGEFGAWAEGHARELHVEDEE